MIRARRAFSARDFARSSSAWPRSSTATCPISASVGPREIKDISKATARTSRRVADELPAREGGGWGGVGGVGSVRWGGGGGGGGGEWWVEDEVITVYKQGDWLDMCLEIHLKT